MNGLTRGNLLLPDGSYEKGYVFSIFSRGCKQYKSIHVNSFAKIRNN